MRYQIGQWSIDIIERQKGGVIVKVYRGKSLAVRFVSRSKMSIDYVLDLLLLKGLLIKYPFTDEDI